MKDDTCTVRDIDLRTESIDVAGFVRILDHYQDGGGRLHLLILCDADPLVWRLRFEVVRIEEPCPRLTGLSYIGRWPSRGVVFMHPRARADDEPWAPGRGDMTLVHEPDCDSFNGSGGKDCTCAQLRAMPVDDPADEYPPKARPACSPCART